MMRKIREYIMRGLATGWVCTTICLLTVKSEAGAHAMAVQFAIWLFASAAYGAAIMVYGINGISTARATALHFLISLVITFIATVAAGYFEIGEWYMFFKKVFPLFVIIYVVITAAVFITIRADARKINKKLGK